VRPPQLAASFTPDAAAFSAPIFRLLVRVISAKKNVGMYRSFPLRPRPINPRLAKFFGTFKQTTLSAGLIVGMSISIGHGIDRATSHFARATSLTFIGLSAFRLHGQAEFDQAARCLRKSGLVGMVFRPLDDGRAQHRSRAKSHHGIATRSGTTPLFWFGLF
jgi:hypothetical protein